MKQKNNTDFQEMERRIKESMIRNKLTYLQLLRNVAIDCDEFILFLRQKSDDFGEDRSLWPKTCGDIFSNIPVLTPFGTCFTTSPNYTQRTSSVGVTERMTLLLSTYVTIVKRPEWLQDEALRSGVQMSLGV